MSRFITILTVLLCPLLPTTILCFSNPISNPQSQNPHQIDVADLGRPAFRIFTDRDGLPQNSIMAMAFGRKGYLWVGTQDGAAYYNGRKWTVMDMPNRTISNYIRVLLAASDGSIWFGRLDGGLSRLKDGEWTTFDAKSGLPSNSVRSLLETTSRDGTRSLWVGTRGGLARLENGHWTVFDDKSGLPNNSVWSLLETTSRNGTRSLWVGTDGGLARLENDKWTVFDAKSSLPNNIVTSLLETVSQAGTRALWVGTQGGLARLENDKWTAFDAKSGLPDNWIYCLLETASQAGTRTLWAGTQGGLARLEQGKWTAFDAKSGLPNNLVRSLLETASQDGIRTLWAGTDGGLARLEQGKWTAFDTKSGLPNNLVRSLLETTSRDGMRSLWVGTGGGLARLEQSKWTVFDTKSGLPNNLIYCLLETASQNGIRTLWAGTQGGLARLENGKWTVFDAKSGLPNNIVTSLLETALQAGTRALWVGTQGGGLARLENGKWTVFDAKSGLPSNVVVRLLETVSQDGTHALWVGTYGGGLARLENDKWTVFDAKSGLSNNGVYCLLETASQAGTRTLWVGTNGGGVSRLDLTSKNAGWITLSDTTRPALPNNVIYQIREDAKKRIYLFTNKGIARLTSRTPTPDDPSEYSIYTFTTEDGLPSNECNAGASMVDSRGRIWAGTIAGAAMFDPSKEVEDRSPKLLYIESALLAGKQSMLSQNASLAYNENSLSFEYALLSFFRESDTRYRTQLVGLDEKPSDWTTDYKKEYPTLLEGSYIFKVWGRDYAGNISGPVIAAFKIRPAPWRTWWAYLFYAAAVAGIGYGSVRLRLQALHGRNQMLEEKITERTAEIFEKAEQLKISEKKAHEASRAKSTFLANMSHELRTPLNGILGFVQLMERDRTLNAEQRENLAIITRSGEHLLALINDVLSLSKIEAGQSTLNEQTFDLRRLLQGLEEMFSLRAQAKGLQLIFDLPAEMHQYVWGDENKLRQVLINLLGNAVKFTETGGISLRMKCRDDLVAFEIEDTGQGMDKADLDKSFEAFAQTSSGQRSGEGTGLGLTISRNFVHLMEGDIRVKSELGKGSTFSFEVRLPVAVGIETSQKQSKVIGLEPGQPPYRILAVDDKWENRTLLVKMMSAVGFEVREAANGKEAVETWTAWQPHLIWMDIRMPVMDGYSATKRIRDLERENRNSGTQIIALTASAFEHDRDAIFAAGCNDYVAKPFREATIFEKITEHLGVRFLYDDQKQSAAATKSTETAVTPAKLAALPPEWIAQLNQAVIEGNVKESYRVIDQIRERDKPLADELRSMIKSYRFDEVQDLVEKL